MLLKGKTAVVFAANGAIGSAVARRFRLQTARSIFRGAIPTPSRSLALRSTPPRGWSTPPTKIRSEAYFKHLADRGETPDIVFNAIGPRAADAEYARPAATLSREKFLLPLETIVWSQFLTARTAAGALAAQNRPGSIVTLSASLSGQFIPFMSGITAACGAVEALTRTLAAEFGRAGIQDQLRQGGRNAGDPDHSRNDGANGRNDGRRPRGGRAADGDECPWAAPACRRNG